MKYLKVWTDFKGVMKGLNDAEKGRLFVAMLDYAETGIEPSEFAGNECFTWGAAKRDIDNAMKESQKNSTNGSKGGRPKATESNEKQTKPTESKTKQLEANESLKEKKRKEKKGNEIYLLDDDEAHEIQQEQNDVLDAAQRAGFGNTQAVFDRLVSLYADNGKEKMISAIEQCVIHGAPNLAYLEAVISGKPKQSKPTKKVVAQDYEQRDYTDVQKRLEEDQRKRFAARLEQAKSLTAQIGGDSA